MTHTPVSPGEQSPGTPVEDMALVRQPSLEDRLASILARVEAGRSATLEDPRAATLLETGQSTPSQEMLRGKMTTSCEPPCSPRPRRKPVNRSGGRSGVWGPSGRDIAREFANAEAEREADPKAVVSAAQKGLALIRGRRTVDDEVAAVPKPLWVASETVTYRMGTVLNDRRAGFMPTSIGELTLADKLLARLHPIGRKNSVDQHLVVLKRQVFRSKHLDALDDDAKLAEANSAVLGEIAHYGHYAKDAAAKMTHLKVLADNLKIPGGNGEETLMELFRTGDAQVQSGLLCMMQHDVLREVAQEGRSSTGVDPFLNLGVVFDEILARVESSEPHGSTKKGRMQLFAESWLQSHDDRYARGKIDFARRLEARRHNYWVRVLSSVQGEYAPPAQDILHNVW